MAKEAANWNRYRWTELSVQYIPAVGSASNGSLQVALSYTSSSNDTAVIGSPKMYTSVTQSKSLVIPTRLLSTTQWVNMKDSCAFIAYRSTGSGSIGNLFFRGTVMFEGPSN